MFGNINQAIYVGACHFGPGAVTRRDFIRTWADMDDRPSKVAILDKLVEANEYAKEKGVPLRLSNVITAGGSSAGLCFGDLVDVGLLTKDYVPGCGPDDHTIRWTVVGDVILSDERGAVFVKGDVNDWPK